MTTKKPGDGWTPSDHMVLGNNAPHVTQGVPDWTPAQHATSSDLPKSAIGWVGTIIFYLFAAVVVLIALWNFGADMLHPQPSGHSYCEPGEILQNGAPSC